MPRTAFTILYVALPSQPSLMIPLTPLRAGNLLRDLHALADHGWHLGKPLSEGTLDRYTLELIDNMEGILWHIAQQLPAGFLSVPQRQDNPYVLVGRLVQAKDGDHYRELLRALNNCSLFTLLSELKASVHDRQSERLSPLLQAVQKGIATTVKKIASWLVETRWTDPLLDEAVRALESGLYQQAVIGSFAALEDELRHKIGSPEGIVGERLVNAAFSPTSGPVNWGRTEAERIGVRNLLSGLFASLRNPAAHQVAKYDAITAASIVMFVNFVLTRITTLESSPESAEETGKKGNESRTG